MYKMAVLDIDGTLLNSRHGITRKTIETVKRLEAKDIPICLCTGRNLNHTLPIVKKLGIKTPFITIDGKIMYDHIERKFIYENKLNKETALKLIDIIAAKNAYLEVVTPHNYFKYIKSKALMKYNIGGTSFFMRHIIQKSYGAKFITDLSVMEEYSDNIFEIVAGGTPEVLESIREELGGDFFDEIDIVEAFENYYIITPRAGRKSDGVRFLCGYYGIDVSKVVAIGDERNDIDMIKMAGKGVAMGNAVEAVKEAADYITLDNNNDGAALALEKFFDVVK